jgi:conjugative relaxase-like TrwC/TraI family protein
MLTIGIIGPKQGESYYAAENYYSEEELLEMSQWWGKGAAKFGLSGVVSKASFKNLLHGTDPTENHRTRGKPSNSSYKERAGVDLTFSAPKSVSLNALVFSDQRL